MSFTDVFKKIFGTKADRDMKAIKPTLDKVLEAYKEIDKLDDDALRARCQALKDKIQAAIAADEARVAEIKAELEKEIPLSQKEALATEQDKLVKKIDETIEKVLDEILPEAFAIMKSTARRFTQNETIRVKATDFDRDLSTTKEFVSIEGDYAVWQNHWMAGGNEVTWDMIHYDVQLIGGIVLHQGKIAEMATGEGKTRVLLSEGLLPQVVNVVRTYAKFNGVELGFIPCLDGATSYGAMLAELAAGDVAGVLVPGINKYGIIEDFTGFADAVHAQKGLFMVYSDPSSLAVLRTPGEWGADVVCGDSQSLGLPLSYGGPYVGFLACRKDYVRKLPGRIVGATRDVDGKRAYVLTLQAREQHIRREKATSNICSNQSLMALYVTVYMSLMGPQGLRQVNELSYGGAHYLHDRLLETGLFGKIFDKPFLKEFTLKSLIPVETLQDSLQMIGVFGAVEVEEGLVNFCVTEKVSRENIDAVVEYLKELGA